MIDKKRRGDAGDHRRRIIDMVRVVVGSDQDVELLDAGRFGGFDDAIQVAVVVPG